MNTKQKISFSAVKLPYDFETAYTMSDLKKPVNEATFGADPELMVYSLEKGRIISALDLLKVDKHNPIDLKDGIKCYADNALIECSMPPANSPEQLVETMRIVLQRMQDTIGPKHRLVAKAAHVFHKDDMSDPRVWEMGCNPNWDAYTEKDNPPGIFPDTLRTGSFHIHIGHSKLLKDNKKAHFIKVLDLLLGLPSIIFDRDPTLLQRRKIYGKAGEFRPTTYGVEYRVLGNYVLRSPDLLLLALDLARAALDMETQNTTRYNLAKVYAHCPEEDVRKIINEGDVDKARRLLETYLNISSFNYNRVVDLKVPDLYRDWKIKV